MIRWIETGRRAWRCRARSSGVVTAPIAKAPLYEAGFAFPGHTEFLAELTAGAAYDGAARAGDDAGGARTCAPCLVTIHEPLAEVPGAADASSGSSTPAVVTAQALRRDFGIAEPRLALAGAQPARGRRRRARAARRSRSSAPAVRGAARPGRRLPRAPSPPTPCSTTRRARRYDAVICLYHDQALIPVKMLDFWGGVNVTLGLPIVRTSPDHGTGFDIAGRGPGARRQPDRRHPPGRRDRRARAAAA